MKKRIISLLIAIAAFMMLLTACSLTGKNTDTCYYVDSIPDGEVYSINKNTGIKPIKTFDEAMIIPEPEKSEIACSVNNKETVFTYTKPNPGHYGSYSYLYTAESGERIKVSPSGTIVDYNIGKPFNTEGSLTTKTAQEVIDIATKYAVEVWGEQFTAHYEPTADPDLGFHIITVYFGMKPVTPGYRYKSIVCVLVDSDGNLVQIKTTNIFTLIGKEVPSRFTDEYIEKKCRELIKDQNAEIEYSPEKEISVINNGTPALGINFRVKGTEKYITLIFPF
ncbi:MAG: hypothetical protein MJ137_08930 [Clostridia bacterium]|nr:hypothetical protein [Clostridia bacterium]